MRDLRVELILHVKQEHQCMRAASKAARGGEEDVCRCGVEFKGDGALLKGDRHRIEQMLLALDEAAMVP